MKNTIFMLTLLFAFNIEAQDKNVKDNGTASVHIEFMGESIHISKERVDSMATKMLESFSAILNDKETKDGIVKSIDKIGEKLDKAIDILVEDVKQNKKVKNDLKAALKDAKPKIDSIMENIDVEIHQTLDKKEN